MRRLVALVLAVVLVAACADDADRSDPPEPSSSAGDELSGPVQIDRALFAVSLVFNEAPTTCTEAVPKDTQPAVDTTAADGSPSCLVMGAPVVDATRIETAQIEGPGSTDRVNVLVQLSANASQLLDEFLQQNLGGRVAVTHRERLVSVATIQPGNLGGRIVMVDLTEDEASDLVNAVSEVTAPEPEPDEDAEGPVFHPGDPDGPGTPLFAGLVVPEGTVRIFAPPADSGASFDPAADVAVLEITGDLLEVWADLVDQVAAHGGLLPGSGVCWWNGSGNPASLLEPRPPGELSVECYAGTAFARAGQTVVLSVSTRLESDGAEMIVSASPGAGQRGPVPDDPGPVDSADLRGLPKDRTPDAPDVGDPFGGTHNCFERGYDRFRLPKGARFVGGGRTARTDPVLEVDDPEAVLEALQDQLDDPDDTSGEWPITHETVDGEEVWSMSGSVEAGGGACHLYTIEDGRYLVVTTHSD
jgi:hypothetical protein